MDESGSLSFPDFTREKHFVIDLTDHFRIGRDAAQFGVISYGTSATLDIKLNQFRDRPRLQYGIKIIGQQSKKLIELCLYKEKF